MKLIASILPLLITALVSCGQTDPGSERRSNDAIITYIVDPGKQDIRFYIRLWDFLFNSKK